MRLRAATLAPVFAFVVAACAPAYHAAAPPQPSVAASASAAPAALAVGLDAPRDPSQAPRYLAGRWTSSAPALSVRLSVSPTPPFDCAASVDADQRGGAYGCPGLFPPAADVRVEIEVTTAQGIARASRALRTMGERLNGVPWFTEFEDPSGQALACAAASVRIVQAFTTGRDTATAAQILTQGRALNRSADPGIDPAAIAAVITALDRGNHYHYYRFGARAAATRSAVYWLVRSAKPVIVLSLGGQHAPVVTGYSGTFGSSYDDPRGQVTGVAVLDPQRGDLDPATARHRPDKDRSRDYQTGKLVGLDEWYGDEWWLAYPYQTVVRLEDGSVHNSERSDGAYPLPHWGGTFVIVVDDGDADTPPDREGRVVFR